MKSWESKFLLVLCFCLLTTSVSSQFLDGPWVVHETPLYIKRALRAKDNYKIPPKAKKRMYNNLSIKEVMEKIKYITKYMNMYAKKNGFKVDYTFRLT